MIVLYTANIIWAFLTGFLRQNKMVNEDGASFLVMGFISVAFIIIIAEILFHVLVNRKKAELIPYKCATQEKLMSEIKLVSIVYKNIFANI